MSPSLWIVMALAVGAPAKDPPKKEPPSIVGEWAGEKAVSGGKELPVPDGGVVFTFTADGGVIFKEAGRGREDRAGATYKVDPKKDPAEIDLIPPPDKKEPMLQGIYKLDGDTLTLCFGRGRPGAERPKSFESPEGAETVVMTLKRKKKE